MSICDYQCGTEQVGLIILYLLIILSLFYHKYRLYNVCISVSGSQCF